MLRFDKEDTAGKMNTLVKYVVADNRTDWGGVIHDDMILESGFPSPMIMTFLNVDDHHYGKYQFTVIDSNFNQGSVPSLFLFCFSSGQKLDDKTRQIRHVFLKLNLLFFSTI